MRPSKNISLCSPADPQTATLRRLVAEIALPGGRMVGTRGHDLAVTWIEEQFSRLNLSNYQGRSFRLPYNAVGKKFCNMVGVIPGENPELPPVVLAAHFDSVIPHPCADDNAAAVAVMLCAAQSLSQSKPPRDIVIASFDAEEPPYFRSPQMGSVRFCTSQADVRGFHAAIVLDLVGHSVCLPPLGKLTPPSLKNLLAIQGAESHPALATIVREALGFKGLSILAALNDYMEDMSDHYAFRQLDVPFLFLSCGQWAHYHRPSDTAEKLDYRKMATITRLTVQLVDRVAHADISGESPDYDFTSSLEAASIRGSLGSWRHILPPVSEFVTSR